MLQVSIFDAVVSLFIAVTLWEIGQRMYYQWKVRRFWRNVQLRLVMRDDSTQSNDPTDLN